jgi:hypothetical protein
MDFIIGTFIMVITKDYIEVEFEYLCCNLEVDGQAHTPKEFIIKIVIINHHLLILLGFHQMAVTNYQRALGNCFKTHAILKLIL